jgi:hypothetical protein
LIDKVSVIVRAIATLLRLIMSFTRSITGFTHSVQSTFASEIDPLSMENAA